MSTFRTKTFHVSNSNSIQLIITDPCTSNFNPSRYHASLIITTSFISHAKSIPNPSSTIHESCQAYIIFHYIHVSHHNIHFQTNTNHSRTNQHPNSTLPRPAPRSGWKVSLRRDELAQARRARSGEPHFA